jgi:ferredoxin
MTPFGIRKKLKSLLGGSKPNIQPVPERPRYTVLFELPDGGSYKVQAKEGDSLVLASGRGAYPIATGCTDGTCATCQVDIVEGSDKVSIPDGHESETKRANGVSDHLRLGCQTAVLGPGVRAKIINVLGEELVE